MERPTHLTVRTRRLSPRKFVAIMGACVLEVAVFYLIATGLTIRGIRYFPHTVVVDFFKTKPPPVRPVVLPRLTLVQPPVPVVSPPEIRIHTPKPPPRIRVARIRPHPAVSAPVQVAVVRPPAPPPPKPRGITAPVSIGASHSCENEYPPLAVRLSQQGTTIVRFMVNTDGSVTNVQVARSSGHEILDEAAVRCAFAWRYRPALDNGHPVAAPWTTNVQWTLRNRMAAPA